MLIPKTNKICEAHQDEQYERKMENVTDQMAYFLLDIISMSLQKLENENQIIKEFLDARKKDEEPAF